MHEESNEVNVNIFVQKRRERYVCAQLIHGKVRGGKDVVVKQHSDFVAKEVGNQQHSELYVGLLVGS